MAIKAGNLRHLVTVKLPATWTVGADGNQTIATYTDTDMWAEIVPLSGYERIFAQQLDPEASYRVRIRYNENVTPLCRIIWGSRTFRVVSVLNTDERNYEMILTCSEEV